VEKVISEFSKSTGKNSNYGLNREILVGKSGYLLVKANVIKQTTATVFVG
jgi:diaminopimelate decarboxylase